MSPNVRCLTAPLAACALAACAGAAPTAPPPAIGEVRGAVVDLTDGSPPIGGAGSEVYLLRAPDDRRADAVRRAPVGGAGPRLAFVVDSVPPGRYYLEACVEVGRGRACAPYAPWPGGAWAPVDVRAGARTDVTVLF